MHLHGPDRGSGPPARDPRPASFLLGALLIPVNSFWIARTEAMDYSGFPTCASLFYNVIFSLILLLLLNCGARRVAPRLALSQRELLIVYAMLATGSSLVGHDTMQMVVPTIPHAKLFATPENRWEELIVPHLPDWLTINTAGEAIRPYAYGHSTLYTLAHLRIWAVPVAAWSFFILCTIAVMLSVNAILSRHWIRSERLTYPIVQIPLLITQNGGATALYRNRLFWAGALLAAGLDLMNGLAALYPLLPKINLKLNDLSPMFAVPPWNAMGWTPISYYPFVVGLSFFMPTNMAFSCWFFYLFRKAQQVTAAVAGYQGGDPWYPYLKEQSFGALIALFAASLWFSRGYLKQVLQAALRSGDGDDEQARGYRLALAVLGGGSLGCFAFLVAAGMSPAVAAIYLLLYLFFIGAMTRIRAEVGPPAHEFGVVGPSHMMILAAGTAVLGPQNLTIFSLLWFQNRMHRGILMPQQAESLKAAAASGMRTRTMAAALALAAVIGVLAAFWALLHLGYARTMPAAHHPGAPGSGFATEHYTLLASYLSSPVAAKPASVAGMGVGAAVALVLARLSVQFYGFPFHPAGYAIGMAFGLDYIWFPILMSWACKTLILRYQGLAGYRRAIPFFVGLVLGEFVVGGSWSFLRGILGIQTYTFFY